MATFRFHPTATHYVDDDPEKLGILQKIEDFEDYEDEVKQYGIPTYELFVNSDTQLKIKVHVDGNDTIPDLSILPPTTITDAVLELQRGQRNHMKHVLGSLDKEEGTYREDALFELVDPTVYRSKTPQQTTPAHFTLTRVTVHDGGDNLQVLRKYVDNHPCWYAYGDTDPHTANEYDSLEWSVVGNLYLRIQRVAAAGAAAGASSATPAPPWPADYTYTLYVPTSKLGSNDKILKQLLDTDTLLINNRPVRVAPAPPVASDDTPVAAAPPAGAGDADADNE